MTWDYDWNENAPAVGDPAYEAHIHQQEDKKATRERINVEHNAPTGTNADTWTHRENTAKIGQGIAAARPAASAANKGHVYFATDTGRLSLDTGGTWTDVLPAYHTDGTVNVTNGDATVTGVGTNWSVLGLGENTGDIFWLDGASRYYRISSITDAGELELSVPYEEGTASGQNYYIGRVSSGQQFLPRAGGVAFDVVLWNAVLGTALHANDKKITNLAAATEAGDALRWEQRPPTFAIGSYTGNATDDREIGIGIDLSSGTWMVFIYTQSGAESMGIRIKTSEDGEESFGIGANAVSYTTGRIKSGSANGFVIGSDDTINKNGVVYVYFVIKLTT